MLIKELDDSAAGIDGGGLVELRPGEPPEHREERRNVGGVVIVEERVPGFGIRLDVVIDSNFGEDLLQSLRGSPVGAVLGAIAADDGTSGVQEALRVDLLGC